MGLRDSLVTMEKKTNLLPLSEIEPHSLHDEARDHVAVLAELSTPWICSHVASWLNFVFSFSWFI